MLKFFSCSKGRHKHQLTQDVAGKIYLHMYELRFKDKHQKNVNKIYNRETTLKKN